MKICYMNIMEFSNLCTLIFIIWKKTRRIEDVLYKLLDKSFFYMSCQ